VNDGASVVGSIAAIVLAITLGSPAVTGVGLTLYAIAVAAVLRDSRRSERVRPLARREACASRARAY